MVNNDAVVTHWNLKAEELMGVPAVEALGKSLFDITLLGKERLREGVQRCQQQKTPIWVKAISLKKQEGDVCLTDILCTPLLDSSGESNGAVLSIKDVSEFADTQANLLRTQEELESVRKKFEESHVAMKALSMQNAALSTELHDMRQDFSHRTADVQRFDTTLGEKQKELVSLQELLETRTGELQSVTTKLDEQKSMLHVLSEELVKKQQELETVGGQGPVAPLDNWKDKLKIYDEIDKCLSITDETLKTKKMKSENDEHTV